MAFLAPAILPLLVLASVPVIIHLLNRRRFQRVDWAPMKYLKLTLKSNRRRLRLEQLLLLALRTLLVAVLIFAVARPLLSQGGLGSWVGGGTRTSRVIVIDDSLSMGYGIDRHSALDTARQVAVEMSRKIGSQDTVTAITTSSPEVPLLREAHLESPERLSSEIEKLSVTETASDWPATFRAIDRYLATAMFPVREVIVFTDLRRSGWGKGASDLTTRWAGQSVTLRVVDTGSRQTANIALLGFEQQTPIALPGTEVRLQAVIRNDQATAVTGAQAVLAVGDELRPIVLPELAPGAVTEVPLSVTVTKPGQVTLKLSLPGDALLQDNTRWLVVDVRPRLDLQLVDGEPSAQAFESATDFLALSFAIGNEPWHVARANDADWSAARPMQSPDVLTLANLASISPENVSAIEQRVRAGMGLMIFCGDQIDAQLYNQRLYREGAGLLPGRLERPADAAATGLVVEQLDQSPLVTLAKLAPAALARIAARKYMIVTVPIGQANNTRVLARWNIPEAHPAVIEKRFGKGRVILWTMSANKEWGDWPLDPTYVLAVRSAALSIARQPASQDNVTAGEPFSLTLEPGQSAVDAKVASPGKETPEPAVIDRQDSVTTVLRSAGEVRAGSYMLKWRDAVNVEQSHAFAANPAKTESDLATISDEALTKILSPLQPQITHYASGTDALTGRGKEIWRMLAMCLLGMMLVETTFAVWVGRER